MELTLNEIREILEKATVVIRLGDNSMPKGTGWLFSSRGYILTAGHVLKETYKDPELVEECNVCFSWKKTASQNNIWIKAKLCSGIHHEDLMLDYAVLKVSTEELPEGSFSLLIWADRWPYDAKCSVLGYHAATQKMNYLTNVIVSGDIGTEYLRLSNQSLIEGFSGSAIFAITNRLCGVLAIQVARYNVDKQKHIEVDTRFALPLNRIIEHWPPFEDLLITGGISAREKNEPLVTALYSDNFSVVQIPSQVKTQEFANEVIGRISALTTGKVQQDLLSCDLLKRLGGLPIAKDICYVGLLFLWLTAELKRSKTIVSRLRKVYAHIQAIQRDALFHYQLLREKNYNAVDYELLKSIKSNIETLLDESFLQRYDDPDSLEIEQGKYARINMLYYLSLRTGLDETEVGKFMLSLETVKNVLATVPDIYDPKDPKYSRVKWEKYLREKGDGLYNPLQELSGLIHIQEGLERTLNGLIDETRNHLRDAFTVTNDIFGDKAKEAKLKVQVPLEDVVLSAILNLPQNTTDQNPPLRGWRTNISI